MLKNIDQWHTRVLYTAMIALMLGLFVWFAGGRILEASLFLTVRVAYAVLVFRVVSQSVRVFTVMLWAFLVNYYTLISIAVQGAWVSPRRGRG